MLAKTLLAAALLAAPRTMHWRDAAVAMHKIKAFGGGGRNGSRDRDCMDWLAARLAAGLAESAASPPAPPAPPTRGAPPPARDRWGKLHECNNVHVVDGSLFPTFPGFNPTLTILANSLRIARAIGAGTT